MFDRLDQLEARYEDLGQQMSDPTLVTGPEEVPAIAKQHRDMEPTVEKFREYRKIKQGIADAKTMLAEDPTPTSSEMAQAELLTP
jgi:peptide chain release factor 1